jgi:hypothetical protein
VRRLLLIAAVVASVAPAAHADPYACVRTRNSKGVPFDVCVPVNDPGATQRCLVSFVPSVPALPYVAVCTTLL